MDLNFFLSFMVFLFGSLTVSSTFYDVGTRIFKRKQKTSLTIFSFWSNFEELCKVNKSTSVINSIDGIKVLTALWIILGHRFERIERPHPDTVVKKIVWKFLLEFFDTVTTFLVCSAILVTQSILRALDRYENKAMWHF